MKKLLKVLAGIISAAFIFNAHRTLAQTPTVESLKDVEPTD